MIVADALVDEKVAVAAVTVGGDLMVEMGEEMLFQVLGKGKSTLTTPLLLAVNVEIQQGEVAFRARKVAGLLALEMLHDGNLGGAAGVVVRRPLEKAADDLAAVDGPRLNGARFRDELFAAPVQIVHQADQPLRGVSLGAKRLPLLFRATDGLACLFVLLFFQPHE